jgi:hypothetical protein
MKVADREPSGLRRSYTLTPWEAPHPKGGEAWSVQEQGKPLGTVRRWEKDEISARIGPRGGTFSKKRAVYWTAYRPKLDDLGVPLGALHSDNNVAHKREECAFCTEGLPTQDVQVFDHRAEALRWLRSKG